MRHANPVSILSPAFFTACASAFLLTLADEARSADGASTDYWVRVMPALWAAQLDGDFSYQRGGSSGSRFTTDQLGIDGAKNIFAIEAGAQIPFLFGFHAGYFDFSTEGTRPLTQTQTFGNQTYAATTQVKTTVGLRDLYGEICIRPLNLDLVGFSVGVAGHSIDGRMELADLTTGNSDSIEKTVFIPAVAVRGHVSPLKCLTLEARVHWIEIATGGNHVRFADADVQLAYRPIEWVGVLAGYRYNLYDLHLKDPTGTNSSADLNLSLSGPYVGLIAKF